MESRAFAIATGVFVLVLGGCLAVAFWWLSADHTVKKPYVVVTKGSVTGLAPYSTVAFRGLAVGSVQAIRFSKANNTEIQIDVALNEGVPVTKGTYATLRIQGVTGTSQLQLQDDGQDQTPLATDPEHPARIPMRPSILDELQEKGEHILHNAEIVSDRLVALFDLEHQERLSRIMGNVEATSERLESLSKQLDQGAKAMPQLSQELQDLLRNGNHFLVALTDQRAQAEGTLADFRALGRSGREVAQRLAWETLPQLEQGLEQMTEAMRQVKALSQDLRDNPRQLLMGSKPPDYNQSHQEPAP